MNRDELTRILFQHQDEKYGDFSKKIIPNEPREKFIGIRSPEYKKILKEIKNDPVIPLFLSDLPHQYHEENILHVILINQIKDYDSCIIEAEKYLPYMTNWAVTDGFGPAVFSKNHSKLISKVNEWISSNEPYIRRAGMVILMKEFLDSDFRAEYLELPAKLRSDDYYVNMMTAWLFAEALVKQWDSALPYITEHRLDPWTNNKTIQKACESFRITDDRKAYLKQYKTKTK